MEWHDGWASSAPQICWNQPGGTVEQVVIRANFVWWVDWKHAWACISVVRYTGLQYVAFCLAALQQQIQQEGVTWLNSKDQYIPVCTSTYDLTYSCTVMYLHVPLYTVPCTVMYHLVPPCTTLYHAGTRQYIPVHTSMYQYIQVCTDLGITVQLLVAENTGMYNFEACCQ